MSSGRGDKRRATKRAARETLSREPKAAVKQQLRQEVGFGCPRPGCGNPYLTWHHFDPEWHVKKHHNPEGMVALCREHHDKAGAYSVEQCREFKANGADQMEAIKGEFEWMKNRILGIVGSNYIDGTTTLAEVKGQRVIWFNRDDRGCMLLNIETRDARGRKRTSLVDNVWTIRGAPEDVESPPNGSYLKVKYADGDRIEIQFREYSSAEKLLKGHPDVPESTLARLEFPVTTAEVKMKLKDPDMWITPSKMVFKTSRAKATFIGCDVTTPDILVKDDD